MIKIKSTDSSRSWFCVWNNPQTHGGMSELSPEQIVEKAANMWVEGKPLRSCAINYEIGDSGTPHLHMVLEDPAKTRFSAVCKLYPGIHCEPTQGTKKDAEAYIYKIGKFAEKGHTLIVPPVIYGEIKGKARGRRILDEIEQLLEAGMTPTEIMELSLAYREKETLIRKAYYAKRFKETPPLRPVAVKYHVGASGTGKSYSYVLYCEEHGVDNVYLATDHSENGMFDLYCGEKYLVIDELRYMKYEILLQITQGYRAQLHARYENIVSLWSQVDITSILPPEKLYENIVPEGKRSEDGIRQFMRRIQTIVYHYVEDGEYKTFELPCTEYTGYEALIARVHANQDGFVRADKLPEYEQQALPFAEEAHEMEKEMDSDE